MLALDLGKKLVAVVEREWMEWTHGTAGHAVKALLALDVDIGAVGSLELDIEGRYNISVSSCTRLKLFWAVSKLY